MGRLPWQIMQFVSMWEGPFKSDDVYRSLGLSTPEDRNALRVALKRLCDRGLINRETATLNGEQLILPGRFSTR